MEVMIIIGKPRSGKSMLVRKLYDPTSSKEHLVDDVMNYGDIEYIVKRSKETCKGKVWIVVGNYPYDMSIKAKLFDLIIKDLGVNVTIIDLTRLVHDKTWVC